MALARIYDEDELVTAREAAALLALSEATFRRRVRSGEIRVVRAGPRSSRFRVGDLVAYIEANRTPAAIPSDGRPKRARRS